MPFVNCTRCELTTFSVSRWSTVELCPSCAAPLPRPRAPTHGVKEERWGAPPSEQRRSRGYTPRPAPKTT